MKPTSQVMPLTPEERRRLVETPIMVNIVGRSRTWAGTATTMRICPRQPKADLSERSFDYSTNEDLIDDDADYEYD